MFSRFYVHSKKSSTNGNMDCSWARARISLGPLLLELDKTYNYPTPHEVTLVVPRVEIRKKLQTPFFTWSKEYIYNSVTLVDAPQAPLSEGIGSTKKQPQLTG